MSPGIDGLRPHMEFHRRGRFDATITLHDGRNFGIVRQGPALRRRSLYYRPLSYRNTESVPEGTKASSVKIKMGNRQANNRGGRSCDDPKPADYAEPPSTNPARTAQTTICCRVLNPSFLWTADTALRTVRALLLLISPISW